MGFLAGTTWSAFSASSMNAGNTFTAAASFCAAPGTQTLTADADAFLRQSSGGSNLGTSSTLRVQSSQIVVVPDNERSVVHFALPSIPTYCTLTGATLRLNASSAAAARTIQAYRATATWSETVVTWNNQPGTAGPPATALSGTGWRTWDVLSQVQAMYSGTNAGFVIRDSVEGSLIARTQVYSSREGANPPELALTFA